MEMERYEENMQLLINICYLKIYINYDYHVLKFLISIICIFIF